MNATAGYTHIPARARAAQPLISVCIPNFNGEAYLSQCIESVLGQDCSGEVEIIVHDDASTDGSIALVSAHYPEVEILASSDNVGFCRSNNRMVEQARGEYLLLLNNDATLRSGSLGALLAEAEHAGRPAIIGLPQYSMTDGALVDRGYEFDLFMNPVPLFMEGTREVATVTGACMWIPREIWDGVGGFPEWFGSVAEDIYLCQAARLLGYPILIMDSPGFDHWIGRNLGGGKIMDQKLVTTTRRRALSERNKTWVMMICYPLPLLLLVMPAHFALLALEALVLLLTGSGWPKVRSIYFRLPARLMEHSTEVRTRRNHIQRRRRLSFNEYAVHFRLLPQKLVMLFRHGLPMLR